MNQHQNIISFPAVLIQTEAAGCNSVYANSKSWWRFLFHQNKLPSFNFLGGHFVQGMPQVHIQGLALLIRRHAKIPETRLGQLELWKRC